MQPNFDRDSRDVSLARTEGFTEDTSDGTILDGHHRIKILKSRGVNVDVLPREIIVRK
jgi:hypothetical protein